jgi:hypothetical protein
MDPQESVTPFEPSEQTSHATRLRVIGAHVIDRYVVVEWYNRKSDVSTYRHLWWLGLS